eukprot:TRINITY_DN3869_c0_g1_i2.p1 TRINITY_DN3869_c0_g1~~TRINITY_DN3869_c0_g1_i2.p1  ORF type:complete len:350 (+),score=43.84 TRINITY_DN3869_c0_g1_i2:53-1102(+)
MDARVILVLVMGILGWAYQAIQPPPPKICGSSNGPPVTSTRVRLRDGRHMAYMEQGVPKEMAKYKIVLVHGFDGTKEFSLPASQEVVEELGIYFVSFDRAGYGESDPNPQRSVKSEAFDIQDLADQLELGSKFYVIGVSMGGYTIWSCLKYIPHRLAGASLIVPVVNYWWPSFPTDLSRAAYRKQLVQDQWTLRIAHYTRPLFYWWMTQKWFPSSSVVERNPEIFSRGDKEIIQKILAIRRLPTPDKARQQGVYESLHRDVMIGFGTWEFDPMNINNPFPHNEGSVHLWQGYEDRLVPVSLQRYVSERLPWIRYHEVPDGGHLLFFNSSLRENILKALLLGEEPSSISV